MLRVSFTPEQTDSAAMVAPGRKLWYNIAYEFYILMDIEDF